MPPDRDEDPIEIVIAEDEAGARIDRILAARSLGLSRSSVQRLLREGRVTLDGTVVSDANARLTPGARVVVRPAPRPPSEAAPEAIPLRILYEDDHLLVIDKPPGLVVHPAPGHPGGTLVNALLHHTGGAVAGEGARAGIVHRLDKDTSGVLVAAKTDAAHRGLVEQFQRHDIERAYLAIAIGAVPPKATYDTLHGRHPTDRKKFTTRVKRGRRAVTHVERLEMLHGGALVRCRLETGRTHQIRVHLAEAGFPILGDPVYGRSTRDATIREVAAALGRQALHAAVLGFTHPVTGEALRFETEPPADFRVALEALRRVTTSSS